MPPLCFSILTYARMWKNDSFKQNDSLISKQSFKCKYRAAALFTILSDLFRDSIQFEGKVFLFFKKKWTIV